MLLSAAHCFLLVMLEFTFIKPQMALACAYSCLAIQLNLARTTYLTQQRSWNLYVKSQQRHVMTL